MTNKIRETLKLGLLALGFLCALVAGLMVMSSAFVAWNNLLQTELVFGGLGMVTFAMPACFGLSLAVSRA